MTATHGLSDKQASLVLTIFAVFFAIDAHLDGLPEEERPPTYVFTILGIIAAAILPIRALLGVRDSSTAGTAKEVNPNLVQHRKPSPDQVQS